MKIAVSTIPDDSAQTMDGLKSMLQYAVDNHYDRAVLLQTRDMCRWPYDYFNDTIDLCGQFPTLPVHIALCNSFAMGLNAIMLKEFTSRAGNVEVRSQDSIDLRPQGIPMTLIGGVNRHFRADDWGFILSYMEDDTFFWIFKDELGEVIAPNSAGYVTVAYREQTESSFVSSLYDLAGEHLTVSFLTEDGQVLPYQTLSPRFLNR